MKKLFLLLLICVSSFVNGQEKQTDNFKKTDEVLLEVVKKALLVAEKTGNFVIEQSPLILQEFYNWHICTSILGIILCLLISVIGLIYIQRLRKNDDLDMSDSEYFFPVVFISVGLFFAVLFLCINIYELVFILVAPKLYLIEYFIK